MPVVMPVEPVAPEALNCGWSTLAVWNTGAWIEPEAEEPWSLDCWSLSIGVGFENSLPNTSNSSAFRRRSPDSGELSSAAARILSSFAISVSVCLSACTFRLLIRPVEQEEEFNKLDSRKLKFTFKGSLPCGIFLMHLGRGIRQTKRQTSQVASPLIRSSSKHFETMADARLPILLAEVALAIKTRLFSN